MSLAAQAWLDAAAFQVQDKRRILAELQQHSAPVELIEAGKSLLIMCEVLLYKAIGQYLRSLR